ncbi:TonB system transport protein ExbD [Aureimonas glaciei]|jgi:biopolymer transport protein ExbD|uniref:Biopolymer transport protein ExbD n=1 Tax=Aureimonas glaciei TaxID=1776957 RepID=A0A917DG67_9HYPH|nr:TonB system transport protein ExbD [Aureimonas glaciei]GGD33149.1 TonB system transport protein ExbD [Aureimonas glaciei]
MGIKLGQSGDDDTGEVSDINVTPFIDVVLVLLIIFMVAAPLSTVDVPVDLPVSNAAPQQRPDEPIFLTVQADLSLSLGNDAVARDALQAVLDARSEGDREQRIFLRADGAVAYSELMTVMNQLRSAGYLKIGLVGLEDTGAAPTGAEPAAAAAPAPAPAPAAVPAPTGGAPATATP